MLQASELADLEDEANMPLEQLMAKYGYTTNTEEASPSQTSSPPWTAPKQQITQLQDIITTSPNPPPDTAEDSLIAINKETGGVHPAAATEAGVSSSEVVNRSGLSTDTPQQAQHAQQAEQAQQASAAGMDAFEYSQALAERRASGSKAGPSHASQFVSGGTEGSQHNDCMLLKDIVRTSDKRPHTMKPL